MDNNKLKTFLKKGSEISGGAIGGAIGLIGGPVGAIVGGAVGVLAGQLMNEVIEKSLSDREKVRIAATSTFIFDGIARRIENGEQVRNDNFFNRNEFDRSNAEEIFEGTLLKCSNQYQEKKIKHISKIFEKTIFDSTISAESANQLLTIVESLTYRKLCILSFYGRKSVDFPNELLMNENYSNYPNINFTTNDKLLLQDLFELINFDLLDKKNWMIVTNKDIIPNILTLTEIGKSLYEIMDLNEIEINDIFPIIEGLKYKNEWGKSRNNTYNGERRLE